MTLSELILLEFNRLLMMTFTSHYITACYQHQW